MKSIQFNEYKPGDFAQNTGRPRFTLWPVTQSICLSFIIEIPEIEDLSVKDPPRWTCWERIIFI